MITIGLTLFILSELILYLILFDVILSWLTLIGLKYRPRLLSDIIDPIYKTINSFIPTTFGPIKFDALIAIIIIWFFQAVLFLIIPGLSLKINTIIG